MSKVRRTKGVGRYFFNETVFDGVYRIILSYIPENRDIHSFSLTCRNIQSSFITMLTRSSTRFYRLNLLNNLTLFTPQPKDFTFDLFGPNLTHRPKYSLDPNIFVSSIEEYEKEFTSEHVFFDILGKINKKYAKPVLMVSGGYALKHFFKVHIFPFPGYRRYGFAGRSKVSLDIDVFILGENKKKVLREVLMEMKRRFEKPEKFVIFSCKELGLVNVECRSEYFSSCRDIPKDIRETRRTDPVRYLQYPDDKKSPSDYRLEYRNHYVERTKILWRQKWIHKRTRNVFQFIMKKIHKRPGDVFAFFDLDCCKIGYFPGLKRVVGNISFIRSLVTKLNYADLSNKNASGKHFFRIHRYKDRTGIKTSIQAEPLLSYYHTFDFSKKRDLKKFPVQYFPWSCADSYGDVKSSSYYYDGKPKEDQRHEFRTLKSFRKTLPCDENAENPYLCDSVGIVVDPKTRKYIYKKMVRGRRMRRRKF